MKLIIKILILFSLIVTLAACDFLSPPMQSVEFRLSGDFEFGSVAEDFWPVTDVFITGSFNEWSELDSQEYRLQEQSNGDWSITLELPAGETIQFKYRIDTTNSDGARWWTDMRQCYNNGPGILPNSSALSFEFDGFTGYNAVFQVAEAP